MKSKIFALATLLVTISLLATTATPLTFDDRCEHTRQSCNAGANYVFETCLIVYGESPAAMDKCLDQADAYAAACMSKGGC